MRRRYFIGAFAGFLGGCATGTFKWPEPDPNPCGAEPPKHRSPPPARALGDHVAHLETREGLLSLVYNGPAFDSVTGNMHDTLRRFAEQLAR